MEDIVSGNGKVAKESDAHPNEHEYSDYDLDEMGETLLKAQEIQSDPSLYAIVKEHLQKQVKRIRSLDDLRRVQKEVEMRDNEMEEAYSKEK